MQQRNVEGLREFGKIRTADSSDKVRKALNQMVRDGEKINICRVAERAGVSTNFIYTHADILKVVRKYCDETKQKRLQSKDSKDVLITTLRNENRELKSKLKAEKENEKYKIRCMELEAENKRLRDELEKAYSETITMEY